jgi:hypothetical protein
MLATQPTHKVIKVQTRADCIAPSVYWHRCRANKHSIIDSHLLLHYTCCTADSKPKLHCVCTINMVQLRGRNTLPSNGIKQCGASTLWQKGVIPRTQQGLIWRHQHETAESVLRGKQAVTVSHSGLQLQLVPHSTNQPHLLLAL